MTIDRLQDFAARGRRAQAAADAVIDAAADQWLTKVEAAKLADVTSKTIERWAAAKWIRKGRRPSRNGGPPVAVYWAPSVRKQAAQRAQGAPDGFQVPALPDPVAAAPGAGLALPGGQNMPVLDPVALALTLASALRAVSQTSRTSQTGPAYVDHAEALTLTGLSADALRKAVEAGEVKRRGRRYRRRDLVRL